MLSTVALSVQVKTSSSSPERTWTTSVWRSPLDRATMRSVTLFTGWEMDRARRSTTKMDRASTSRVDSTATSMAPLI